MSEKITGHTMYQAQRLDQLLRVDAHFQTAERKIQTDNGKKVKIENDEGAFEMTIEPHLAYAFWRTRKGLVKDLQREGMGDIALQLLKTRVHQR